MRYCKCDHCGEDLQLKEMKVHLTGVTGTQGGILLPEWMHEKDFCDPTCFWEWCRARDPLKYQSEQNYPGE